MRRYRAVAGGMHNVLQRGHNSRASNARASAGSEFSSACPATSEEQQTRTPQGISNQVRELHNRKSKTISAQICMRHQIPCETRTRRWASTTKVPIVLS